MSRSSTCTFMILVFVFNRIVLLFGKEIICDQQFCDLNIICNDPSCYNDTYICTSSVAMCSIKCNDCINTNVISSASITNLACLGSDSCDTVSIDIMNNQGSFDLICSAPSSCNNIILSCKDPELCQCKDIDDDDKQCSNIQRETFSTTTESTKTTNFPSNPNPNPSNSALQKVNAQSNNIPQTANENHVSSFHMDGDDTAVVFLITCVTLFWILVCFGIPLFVKWYRDNYIIRDKLHISISEYQFHKKEDGNNQVTTQRLAPPSPTHDIEYEDELKMEYEEKPYPNTQQTQYIKKPHNNMDSDMLNNMDTLQIRIDQDGELYESDQTSHDRESENELNDDSWNPNGSIQFVKDSNNYPHYDPHDIVNDIGQDLQSMYGLDKEYLTEMIYAVSLQRSNNPFQLAQISQNDRSNNNTNRSNPLRLTQGMDSNRSNHNPHQLQHNDSNSLQPPPANYSYNYSRQDSDDYLGLGRRTLRLKFKRTGSFSETDDHETMDDDPSIATGMLSTNTGITQTTGTRITHNTFTAGTGTTYTTYLSSGIYGPGMPSFDFNANRPQRTFTLETLDQAPIDWNEVVNDSIVFEIDGMEYNETHKQEDKEYVD